MLWVKKIHLTLRGLETIFNLKNIVYEITNFHKLHRKQSSPLTALCPLAPKALFLERLRNTFSCHCQHALSYNQFHTNVSKESWTLNKVKASKSSERDANALNSKRAKVTAVEEQLNFTASFSLSLFLDCFLSFFSFSFCFYRGKKKEKVSN